MNVIYHCYVKKPQKLIEYGFEEQTTRYVYKTNSKNKEVIVWKSNAKRRTANQLTFAYGSPQFTMELAYLFANLLADKVIEFTRTTKNERIQNKIDKLRKELDDLCQKTGQEPETPSSNN